MRPYHDKLSRQGLGVRRVADVVPSRSLAGWGCTWAYIPIQTNELGAADAPLSRQADNGFQLLYGKRQELIANKAATLIGYQYVILDTYAAKVAVCI